jgi:hypothetical protein
LSGRCTVPDYRFDPACTDPCNRLDRNSLGEQCKSFPFAYLASLGPYRSRHQDKSQKCHHRLRRLLDQTRCDQNQQLRRRRSKHSRPGQRNQTKPADVRMHMRTYLIQREARLDRSEYICRAKGRNRGSSCSVCRSPRQKFWARETEDASELWPVGTGGSFSSHEEGPSSNRADDWQDNDQTCQVPQAHGISGCIVDIGPCHYLSHPEQCAETQVFDKKDNPPANDAGKNTSTATTNHESTPSDACCACNPQKRYEWKIYLSW